MKVKRAQLDTAIPIGRGIVDNILDVDVNDNIKSLDLYDYGLKICLIQSEYPVVVPTINILMLVLDVAPPDEKRGPGRPLKTRNGKV